MKVWLDSIDVQVVQGAANRGMIAGVTTNPSLLSRAEPGKVRKKLDQLLDVQGGPVAVQVTEKDVDQMVDEARAISSYSSRFIVKIFANARGFAAIHKLKRESTPILATGVVDPRQAILAAQLGVDYIAPYFSHIPGDAKEKLKGIIAGGSPSKVLVASLRSIDDVILCAELGADAVTIKEGLFQELVEDHPLVKNFEDRFLGEWNQRQGNSLKDCLS